MTEIVLEWLNVLLRWAHVIAAIMWIGDSLLFMWIDSHLHPDPERRKDVAGVTWLIHGGGYYHLEKRLLVPGRLPPTLRWFWLEATTTWISGFLLLVLIYYLNADAFLLDRSISHLIAGQAIVAGLVMLAGGWLIYDVFWRVEAMVRRPLLATVVSFAALSAVSYAATRLLSARAAFMHVGAMLGTIMAANVWVHILPPQWKMLLAARAGREVDYSLGIHAKTRSTHNTYLTFPVIFLMISHHFPAIYAARWNWVVLLLFVVLGAGVRHVMMVGFKAARWTSVATAASALALIYLTVPKVLPAPALPSSDDMPAPSFAEVRTIIFRRCTPCHSDVTTMPDVTGAGGGVRFDRPDQIKALAVRIKVRAVEQKTMPPGNRTVMTGDERSVLGRWVDAGAPLR